NDTCNGVETNRVCKVASTNRDRYKKMKAYDYLCKTGYEQVPGIDIYQSHYNQIYTTLQVYRTYRMNNQCAANPIDCGGGTCAYNANSNNSLPTCYCNNSLTLIQLSAGKYDCILSI
ncbi:unnamed protein product, partial [Rotaria sp. Silwood2]